MEGIQIVWYNRYENTENEKKSADFSYFDPLMDFLAPPGALGALGEMIFLV